MIDEIFNVINSNRLNNINGLLLSNREIDILDKYNIDYKKCKSLKDVLYLIEQVEYNDELESISLSISERDYYQNTNK